uniref:Cytochrome b561 domain-containing protein n=1 Tax=Glossina brevipalpis TaxID=37001 RepID=A0A1A9WTJ4_9MUSC
MKLKITTIIAVILLIPYLILGGFLVYFLYDVDNCSPSWYYNAEMDDLKIDDALLAIINSHYKNVTVIPDPKVQERDNFQPELVQPLLNEEPEPPDETEILSDWLDIQVLQPQSHLTTRRPWKAYKPPEILPPDLDSDLVEENVAEATNKPESFVDFENDQNFEEIDQNLDEISKISRSEKRGKRRRKEHKRHGNNEKDKDHRTGKGSRSKKSRKRHKTDNTTTTEFDEPLPIPLRFSNNNYCLTPYHGMLCMVGTILMGLNLPREPGLFEAINTVAAAVTEKPRNILGTAKVLGDMIELPKEYLTEGNESPAAPPGRPGKPEAVPEGIRAGARTRTGRRSNRKRTDNFNLNQDTIANELDEEGASLRKARKVVEPKTRSYMKDSEDKKEATDKYEQKRETNNTTEDNKKIKIYTTTQRDDSDIDIKKFEFEKKSVKNDNDEQRDRRKLTERHEGISFDQKIIENQEKISSDKGITKERAEMSSEKNVSENQKRISSGTSVTENITSKEDPDPIKQKREMNLQTEAVREENEEDIDEDIDEYEDEDEDENENENEDDENENDDEDYDYDNATPEYTTEKNDNSIIEFDYQNGTEGDDDAVEIEKVFTTIEKGFEMLPQPQAITGFDYQNRTEGDDTVEIEKALITIEKGFEMLPQPQAVTEFDIRFCNNPMHGILCVFSTIFIGFIIIISISLWISKDSGYSTPRSFLDLHVYGGWAIFVLLCLQLIVGIAVYICCCKKGNMRQFIAPFHDIIGIFIFICLVGACLSGKRGLRNDYVHFNMILYYVLTYIAYVIILYILLSPYYEWALVGPL